MADGEQAGERHRAGLRDHVLLGDPALEEALREALPERDEPGVEPQVAVERDEPRLALGLRRRAPRRRPAISRCGRSAAAARAPARSLEPHRLGAEPREPLVEPRHELLERARRRPPAPGAPEWKS